MGDLSAIQKGGDFSFTIPGKMREIKASARHIKAQSKDDYEWHGTIEGGIGSVIVLSRKGKITASISLPNEEYELLSTDDDIHLLVAYDMEVNNTPIGCATESTKDRKQKTEGENPIAETIIAECLDYVRVLVLYTPAARQAVADINQTIDLCISQFNSTIYNSNITSRAVIELAGRQELNFIETNNITDDKNRLTQDASAQTARNNTNADLVILLANGAYGSTWGKAATVEPDNALSYAVVQAIHATGANHVFVHEAGHLYGCRHNLSDDSGGQPYAHGHIFKPNFFTTCFTAMALGGKSNLLNFSNPNVYVQGKPTGIESTNNNARRITETYSTLIGFRSFFRPTFSGISGPDFGYAYRQYTWEAIVGCGNGPFTYEWRTSYDGFNYGSVRSTSDRFAEYLPCPAGNYYYIRLTVRGNDGQASSSVQTVYIDKSTCQSAPYIEQKSKGKFMEEHNNLTLQLNNPQPNPAMSNVTIEFSLPEQKSVRLELFHTSGQKIKTLISGVLSAGVHNKQIDVKGLQSGTYFLRLASGNFQRTKPLIVQ